MKSKKWLCVLLCCGMLLTMLAACNGNDGATDEPETPPVVEPETPPAPPPPPPPTPHIPYMVDFFDGKTDFLMINTGTPGTDRDSAFEIATLDGKNALKLTAPNGRALRLGINVGGLLGDSITDVRNIVFDVYAEYPDGNFSAVSGKIVAMSGDTETLAETNWQIYIASRNPNPTTLEIPAEGFTTAGPNFIEFALMSNGPAEKGETPAEIYIKSIAFFDESNEVIEINSAAGWEQPDGWGEFIVLGGWVLPIDAHDGVPGRWETWMSPGVDGNDYEDMPWEVVAASYGIVFEMEEPDTFEFVYFGSFNGWNWTQTQIAEFWADGQIRVMWDDIGFDPTTINEEDNGVKLAMGNWNEYPINAIYLLYDEDAVDLG